MPCGQMSQIKQLLADTLTHTIAEAKKLLFHQQHVNVWIIYICSPVTATLTKTCPYTVDLREIDRASVKCVSFRGKSPFKGGFLQKPGLFWHLQKLSQSFTPLSC